MRTTPLIRTVGSAIALAAVWACSGSDSTSPTTPSSAFDQTVTADLAPSAAEDISTDYNFYSGASASSMGLSFAILGTDRGWPQLIRPGNRAFRWFSKNCQYDSTSTSFQCPSITKGNHSFTASYTVYDANGTPQSAYDSVTTASIMFQWADSGATGWDFNHSTFGDTSSRQHVVTVSNLAGNPDTVQVWNGTGTGHIHSVHTGQIAKIYDYQFADSAQNLAIRLPHDVNPYPLSGTIIKNYTVTRTRQASDTTTRTTTRRVVVTFDGTSTATMTIGDSTYSINLDSHRLIPRSHRF